MWLLVVLWSFDGVCRVSSCIPAPFSIDALMANEIHWFCWREQVEKFVGNSRKSLVNEAEIQRKKNPPLPGGDDLRILRI